MSCSFAQGFNERYSYCSVKSLLATLRDTCAPQPRNRRAPGGRVSLLGAVRGKASEALPWTGVSCRWILLPLISGASRIVSSQKILSWGFIRNVAVLVEGQAESPPRVYRCYCHCYKRSAKNLSKPQQGKAKPRSPAECDKIPRGSIRAWSWKAFENHTLRSARHRVTIASSLGSTSNLYQSLPLMRPNIKPPPKLPPRAKSGP